MKLRTLCGAFVATASIGAATVAGMPLAQAAGPGMSVTIGSPIQVANRLMVNVPVNVVCDPIGDANSTVLADAVTVTVAQANGKTVSQAQATLSGGRFSPTGNPNPFLTCDGSTVNQIVVSAVGNGPFHGGGAVATATASHAVGTCFGTFCSATASEFAATGSVAVNLKGGG